MGIFYGIPSTACCHLVMPKIHSPLAGMLRSRPTVTDIQSSSLTLYYPNTEAEVSTKQNGIQMDLKQSSYSIDNSWLCACLGNLIDII